MSPTERCTRKGQTASANRSLTLALQAGSLRQNAGSELLSIRSIWTSVACPGLRIMGRLSFLFFHSGGSQSPPIVLWAFEYELMLRNYADTMYARMRIRAVTHEATTCGNARTAAWSSDVLSVQVCTVQGTRSFVEDHRPNTMLLQRT